MSVFTHVKTLCMKCNCAILNNHLYKEVSTPPPPTEKNSSPPQLRYLFKSNTCIVAKWITMTAMKQ